ncbi:MAG TPA: hypothetical protein VNT81_14445 [Vicinamibacterales bacterium]|nr:hypothetical protein [Vicinamibacterales bacterium]
MIAIAALLALLTAPVAGQDPHSARVIATVRAAMAPALPFPDTTADGSVPVNNNTEALWMIRTDQGDQTIDVYANPLNEVVQLRATRAMAQIDTNIQAAQRRATAQYEAAVAEAKRTGRSQAVDGVSLNDEGVAGERIDAESHASITVEFDQREYRFLVPGGMEPSRVEAFPYADSVVLMVPGHVYKDEAGTEHYAESHRIILLGRNLDAKVTKQRDGLYAVTAVPTTPATAGLDSLVLHIRGNSELVSDILAKTNWSQVLELLKQEGRRH